MGNSLSCCIPPGVSESKTSKRTRRSVENGLGGFDVRDEHNARQDVIINKHYSRTNSHNFHDTNGFVHYPSTKNSESVSNIQHISEREPEDGINDPSINPRTGPLFMVRSKSELREGRERKRRSQYNGMENQGEVFLQSQNPTPLESLVVLGTPSDVSAAGSGGPSGNLIPVRRSTSMIRRSVSPTYGTRSSASRWQSTTTSRTAKKGKQGPSIYSMRSCTL